MFVYVDNIEHHKLGKMAKNRKLDLNNKICIYVYAWQAGN